MVSAASAAQAPNPRGTGTASAVVSTATSRNDAADVRSAAAMPTSGEQVSRSATKRPASVSTGRSAATLTTTGVVASRSAARQAVSSINRGDASTATARSGSVPVSAARSATTANSARSAVSNVSRANTSRATAVFDDVSKLGGGYATCRDAYNTCMDQFCAKANETYRRCYCSAKFTEFRDTEYALDEAKTLLMRFEDNNLNAVDKTAAEVSAMYSATVGEKAIKNDTSAAQKTLNEIGDLLSGKKKASTTSTTSLGILSLDFNADIGDIWGDGTGDIFGTNSGVDMSKLEGQELYNAAHKQCVEMISSSCENSSTFNMARSSYNILITQDCNAYEKKVNTQKEAVSKTVREAEKILREARLEEYRAHNSADVNECVTAVKKAITSDNACGANYRKCLDYSGMYIDVNTGEPIYSPHLFKLTEIITLDGTSNIVQANAKFNQFLNTKKMYAETALDTCRGKADTVWEEFKRSAIIEIAQAQDAKIEEVKGTCVSTMAECYDTQSSALANFDTTTAQATGALNAYAARQMCAEKVSACAALYGNGETCKFDTNGKLTTPHCGMTALLNFVQVVDNVKVAEGCATAIDGYVKDLCTPVSGTQGFPWNCRLKTPGNAMDTASGAANASVAANIKQFAVEHCSDPAVSDKTYNALPVQTRTQVEKAISNIAEELEYQMMDVCEDLDGYWLDSTDTNGTLLTAFYSTVYGGNSSNTSWGRCVENSTMIRCLSYNTDDNVVATYDRVKDECTFTDAWYAVQCSMLGNGYYENGICYVTNQK